ncbi:MAG: DinB family protein [Planctomycetota bacterium]
MQRPGPGELAPFYQRYVDLVPNGDVLAHLRDQGERSRALLAALPAARAEFAYAPDKWTIKRLWQHVVDGERVFAYRALCIARGETGPLPGFEEDVYAANDGTDARGLLAIVDDYAAVRAATCTLFAGFEGAAWVRRGVANQNPVSVRALAWMIAGHELHHLAVLRERYGLA